MGYRSGSLSSDLIYDVGLHKGEDSEFYLAKGFRVIGVEANPAMCAIAEAALQPFVQSGRLIIANVAVSDRRGLVPFFTNTESVWGTIVKEWSDLNAARGCPSDLLEVPAVTLAELVRTHGDAHYIKIDIEGMDVAALRSLATTDARPPYISIESAFPRDASYRNSKVEFEALSALGYRWFKIVPQHEVAAQTPPRPALEGNYVPFRFSEGSSGLFGEEAPGVWLSLAEAQRTFRQIIRDNSPQARLFKHYRYYLAYAKVMRRLGKNFELGWYDIHARHADAGT